MRLGKKKMGYTHTDTVGTVFAIIMIMGIINHFADIGGVWYVWNIAVILAPLMFIATHYKMKDHGSKYLIFVLLSLSSIAVAGMGISNDWGVVEAGSMTEKYWDVILFYVVALYSFLIGTRMKLD